MHGIENLKKITKAIGVIGSNVDDIFADGIGFDDLDELMAIMSALMGLNSVDFTKMKHEILDLDAKEKMELAACFKEHFDLNSDSTEAIIEEGLTTLIQVAANIQSLIKVIRRVTR